MKKVLFIGILILYLLFIKQTVSIASGLLYTDASYPNTATGVKIENFNNLKKGSSSVTNVMGLVEMGNASIDEIAQRAGIKEIVYIDRHEKSVFIFFTTTTITVYGK